ncbi:MAG: T9SS type A sorting domain-containing protein [Bacteroidales bacterium]|nr:T9SS type A sorting domain-containing protein [Bacteroidales bacterium]
MEKVTLWDGVTVVDQGVFTGSTAIKALIVLADNPPSLADDSFDESLKGIDVFVMCDRKDAYDNSDWKVFTNIQEDCNLSGIEQIASNNTINIYPNPASDFISVQTQGDVSITNSLGQIVKFIKNLKQSDKIDISDLENRIYFVNAGRKITKLVVQ